MTARMKRTAMKEQAQEMLMHAVGDLLGYWQEKNDGYLEKIPPAQVEEFREVLQREADRVAHLFGFTGAWSN